MTKPSSGLLPQVTFNILLALSLKPRHGYELMQQVNADSAGRVKLGPGALYGSIKSLVEGGLIEQIPPQATADRRRYYQLTSHGRARLGADIKYYEQTVKLARDRQIFTLRTVGGSRV